MSTDDNKNLNLRWIQAFNERDWQAETACRSLDFQAFVSGAKEPLNADAWAAFMSAFPTAFPDARRCLRRRAGHRGESLDAHRDSSR